MFPEGLRKAVGNVTSFSIFGAKTLFSFGKSATWIAASSAAILVLPVMFEGERAQLQEQQIQQQRQILLGPNAAVSGSAGAGGLLPGAMPGVMQVPVPQRWWLAEQNHVTSTDCHRERMEKQMWPRTQWCRFSVSGVPRHCIHRQK